MKELKELKERLINKLGDSFRHSGINNIPYSPMAIIYLDEKSLQVKEGLDPIFQSIWGDNRKAIVQIAMNGEGFKAGDSEDVLTEEDFLNLIDEMYASDESFRDMTNLRVFFIQSTGDCQGAEDFIRKNDRIDKVRELISDGLLSTSIILLDESIKNRRAAKEIRQSLREKLIERNNECNSTIILSNRLSNGTLLAGKRIRENYTMVGWIILLMNSISAGYKPDDSAFYPMGQNVYLTAAFSEITRPNKEICDIVLHTVLTWIDRQMRNNGNRTENSLDVEDLYQLLGISGGKAQAIEDFFRLNVSKQMPGPELFRYIPRVRPEVGNYSGQMFMSVDQECLGGCSALLKQTTVFDKHMETEVREYLQNYIRDKLSAAEREKLLTASNIQRILLLIQPEHPNPKAKFDAYILNETKAIFTEWILPIFEQVLSEEHISSVEYTKEFDSIMQEFQQGYILDNPELENYYANLALTILEGDSGKLGARLIDGISQNSKNREVILDCISRAVEEIFSARDIFRAPLEQEMVRRMGQNPHDIHNQIYTTLFKDLDGYIRLKTTLGMTAQKQITIVNQRGEYGEETELYRSIRENVSDKSMTYFDSCNGNSIRILRFYLCDSSCLL